MRAGSRLVLPLVFCGLLFGVQTTESRGGADGPDSTAVRDTMSTGEWRKQLEEWRQWIREADRKGPDERGEAAKEQIRGIRDVNAVRPLEAMLSDGREHWRTVFLEPLARIGGRQALKTLVRVSVMDSNVRVREAAARQIGGMENGRDAIPEYIKYLRSAQYSDEAAEALSWSGLAQQVSIIDEPDPALTNALINALVLKGTKDIPMIYRRYYGSFQPRVGGYHASSGSVSERVYVPVHFPLPNPKVLETLVEYTGENYGYDQNAWKRWYQKRRTNILRDGS